MGCKRQDMAKTPLYKSKLLYGSDVNHRVISVRRAWCIVFSWQIKGRPSKASFFCYCVFEHMMLDVESGCNLREQ